MFKLFGAIGRFFRAILYSCAGDFSKWTEKYETNTGYVTAEYEDITNDQKRSINDTTDAVAGLMEIVGQKEHRLQILTQQIEDLNKKRIGAQAKAKKTVAQLQKSGKTMQEIQNDPTVLKCSGFFEDFSTSVKDKEEEAAHLEKEIEKQNNDLARYKTQLQRMHTELKKIKAEKHETIADLEIAKQEEKVNAAILGISDSKTEERRGRIQELRRKRRAKSDINAEMAGIANEDAEQEFLDFATKSEAQNDFFDSIGISETEITTEFESGEGTKIPEE
jgi:chromosome segregation ATPase